MKAFFSYAHEDAEIVDQIYRRVAAAYPDAVVWMDKYQIVAGQDLIDKIAAGMDDADKFFIFLSKTSITKPWVMAELRRAIIKDIEGIKPEYIVPVKLGPVDQFPAFIESKKYIDLENLTEEAWLREFYGAMIGAPMPAGVQLTPNLKFTIRPNIEGKPNAIAVLFEAMYWSEDVSFEIRTKVPFIRHGYRFPKSSIPPQGTSERVSALAYAQRVERPKLTPTSPFFMWVQFPEGVDLLAALAGVTGWDGRGATAAYLIDAASM